MRVLHLVVRGSAVVELQSIEQRERFDWDQINRAGQTADAGAARHLIKTIDTISVCQEFYVHDLPASSCRYANYDAPDKSRLRRNFAVGADFRVFS
jgi:hypothetical protein